MSLIGRVVRSNSLALVEVSKFAMHCVTVDWEIPIFSAVVFISLQRTTATKISRDLMLKFRGIRIDLSQHIFISRIAYKITVLTSNYSMRRRFDNDRPKAVI